MAAELAHRNDTRLATLILVGAAGLRVEGVEGIDVFLRTEEQGLRDRFHDPAKAEAAAARMLAPESEDVRLQNAVSIARVAWSPRLHDLKLAKWLHRIKVPTLIVWGEHDRLLPRAHAEAWSRGIPGSKVAIIKSCGHAVALEQPDALVAAILDHTAKPGRAA